MSNLKLEFGNLLEQIKNGLLIGPQGPKGDTGNDGAQGAAGETGPQGATGAAGPTVEFSFVDHYGPDAIDSAGNFTVGTRFCVLESGRTCTGIRFYLHQVTGRNYKACLWDVTGGGTQLKTVTSASISGNLIELTFSSAQALTSHRTYMASVYENSGSIYPNYTAGSVSTLMESGTGPVYCGRKLLGPCFYLVGDGCPVTSSPKYFPVEPILV